MAPIAQKYRLAWPWNANAVEKLDTMLEDIYKALRNGTIEISPTQFVGVLAATQGGTGLSLYVIGDMLYANTTTTLGRLTIGAANSILVSGGTTPSWSVNPTIGSGNRIVTLNDAIATITPGGILFIGRPDDGALRGGIGIAEAATDDLVIYNQSGGAEIRFISAGGTSAGFGFYAESGGTEISKATAFGGSRPTSKLVTKIDGNGLLGILTATPLSPLHVKVGTDQNYRVRTDGSSNTQLTTINDANNAYVKLKIDANPLVLGVSSGGKTGNGVDSPTAGLHLAAGSASASTAPLKLNNGTKMSSAESGAVEFNGQFLVTNSQSLRFPIGGTLFDHYADVGNSTTAETDLVSDTLIASTLASAGDKVNSTYAGIFVTHVTATRQLRVYFAGTLIFDSGALTIAAGADAWNVSVKLIRVSSSVVRATVAMITTGAAVNAFTTYTEVTGLTLSNTNILKITGTAAGVGAATNDIVAKLGTVSFAPAT